MLDELRQRRQVAVRSASVSSCMGQAPSQAFAPTTVRQNADRHMRAGAALPRRAGASRQTSATPTALLAAAAGPSTSGHVAHMTQELVAAAPDAAAERAQPASRPAAAAAPAAVPTRISRRNLLLAAAVVTVWALFTAAHLTNRPLFLVRPPITRCVPHCIVLHYTWAGCHC